MKYYIIQSNKNTRGIWVQEDDVQDTIEYDFAGHKRVTKTEITEEHYMHLLYN